MQHSSSFLLEEIKLYKDKITVRSTELEYFLKYLDEKVNKKSFFFCAPGKATVAPSFARAFQTLTQREQQDYYLACLKIVYDFNQQKEVIQPQQTSEKVEIQLRLDNKLWKKTTVVINSKEASIEIELIGAKINLEHYLIRTSKTSDRFAFVLESTKADCAPQSIRLGFTKKQDFQKFITKIYGVLMNGLKKKISKLIGLTRQSADYAWLQQRQGLSVELSHKSVADAHKSLRTMLKSKRSIQIDTSTELSKETISKEMIELIEGLSSFDQYQLLEEGFFVHHTSKRVRKVCLFEAESLGLQRIIDEFSKHQNFKLWKKSIRNISLIGELESQNIRVYHEIDLYTDGKEVDYVFLRCRIEKDGCTYFIDKSIASSEYGSHQTSDSRGKIEYCLWKISQDSQLIQILVETQISHIPCKDTCQAMNEYIGELQNIPLCLQSGIPLKSKKLGKPCVSFFSMQPQSFNISPQQNEAAQQKIKFLDEPSQQSQFYSIDLNNQNQLQSIKESQIQIRGKGGISISSTSSHDQILKQIYRYQVRPQEIEKHQYRQFKNDKFFDEEECVANQVGDLVFTNQDKIKAQGGVIKSVLKKIGTNLFSGKSVLNVSFPIEIFAPDTNIQRLCKGMAYAPHFLEKKMKSTPLQRMKAAICFALGNLLLYIDMAKPFNPILGETYQGFIDGCPIYGQQTSHHPPISSLFLVGRGYFVSGNIQATVNLGMNSVSGTNAGEYRISFHQNDPSKNVVIFTSPPGELSGVIYGERKLNITDKSHFFDPENQLFCELHWGKKKSKNPVSRFHDYLEGKIVELSKPASSLAKVKPNDKDTILGYITGRWTETIFFDGETIFQVNKLLPFKVTDQKIPLQSDSRLRMDRVLVQRGQIAQAQLAKQKLQELQRKDRKLREKYYK